MAVIPISSVRRSQGSMRLLLTLLFVASLCLCPVVFQSASDPRRLLVLQKRQPMAGCHSSSSFQKSNDGITGQAPNNDSSWVKTLDYSNRVSCGYYKCFFPLGDNNKSTDDEKAGYLVVQDQAAKRFQSLQQSFALGSFLHSAFGAYQMALEEPRLIEISAETATKLNTNLYYDEDKEAVKKRFRPGPLVVQKQRQAPSPSLIFGTTKWKRHLLFSKLETFMQEHVGLDDYSKQQFAKNLDHQLLLSQDLIEKVRCLAYDFQVFVDRKGNFFHFDLDRCFLHSPEDEDDVLERFGRRKKELLKKVNELISDKSLQHNK